MRAWRAYNPSQVEEMGTRLLRKYGLSDWRVWTKPLYRQVKYGDTVARCYYDRKEIVISLEWTDSRYEIRQNILHEIAHALAGPRAYHGPRWQKKARELGVSERDISTNLAFARAEWENVGCWPWQGVLAVAKPSRNRPSNRRPVG